MERLWKTQAKLHVREYQRHHSDGVLHGRGRGESGLLCFKLTDFNRPRANPSRHYPVVNLVTNVVRVICGIAAHDANELGLFVAGADHYFTVEACRSLHRGFARPPIPGPSPALAWRSPFYFCVDQKSRSPQRCVMLLAIDRQNARA